MPRRARSVFTFAEYLALEEESPTKHEFLDGVVYAMAGGSPEHAAVAANVIRVLGAALEGKRCRVLTSDLRIRVAATGLRTYPDVSVIGEQLAKERHRLGAHLEGELRAGINPAPTQPNQCRGGPAPCRRAACSGGSWARAAFLAATYEDPLAP